MRTSIVRYGPRARGDGSVNSRRSSSRIFAREESRLRESYGVSTQNPGLREFVAFELALFGVSVIKLNPLVLCSCHTSVGGGGHIVSRDNVRPTSSRFFVYQLWSASAQEMVGRHCWKQQIPSDLDYITEGTSATNRMKYFTASLLSCSFVNRMARPQALTHSLTKRTNKHVDSARNGLEQAGYVGYVRKTTRKRHSVGKGELFVLPPVPSSPFTVSFAVELNSKVRDMTAPLCIFTSCGRATVHTGSVTAELLFFFLGKC